MLAHKIIEEHVGGHIEEPIPLKDEIDICLNCTKPKCTGDCEEVSPKKKKERKQCNIGK